MNSGRDILQHIGRTPLVSLPRIARGLPVPVLVKCEHMNPGGSVKDRIAKAIVDDAEARGVLRSGMTLTFDAFILDQKWGVRFDRRVVQHLRAAALILELPRGSSSGHQGVLGLVRRGASGGPGASVLGRERRQYQDGLR